MIKRLENSTHVKILQDVQPSGMHNIDIKQTMYLGVGDLSQILQMKSILVVWYWCNNKTLSVTPVYTGLSSIQLNSKVHLNSCTS